MVWFALLSYQFFALLVSGGDHFFALLIGGVGFAFLSIFMFKSLFIFKKKEGHKGLEVKVEEEPLLFDYLYKLADEIGAPRPHKVYLSSEVNACVFYDLSIFNLFFPSKKNLEIGLGLVNVLNLGEFKSILAHEFGHFAQRSMLLGRYVYTAQQIAIRVVNKRDALDSFLAGVSSFDLRIAWIGWILSILVWAMRSLIQTLFSVVVIAERALSKEMEFQADIVAVSLTGSDALINSLHKLRIADQAYQAVIDQVNRDLQHKKAVPDLFHLQSHYIEKMKWVMNDPGFGESPEITSVDGSHRLFSNITVNPPQMWATHPTDNEREENAKRIYIAADIDNRSSWSLFDKAEHYRTTITANLIATANLETEEMTLEESIAAFDKDEFQWYFMNPKYKGAYINRLPFLNFKTVEDIYDTVLTPDELNALSGQLYTQSYADKVQEFEGLKDEIQRLVLVQHEVVTAEKRKIVHRGNEIKRKDIPRILAQLNEELEAVKEELIGHEKRCRKLPMELAEQGNPVYANYLKSVAHLVHYSEHAMADLKDAYKKYNNVLNIVLADGRVSSSELIEVINVANSLHKTLKAIFDNSRLIKLNTTLVEKLGGKTYGDLFEPFTLGGADKDNIESWSKVINGWVNVATDGLLRARNAAFEHLLVLEDQIVESATSGKTLQLTVEEITLPDQYATLVLGEERPIQYKYGLWDRFHMGDGIFGGFSKFAVSALLIVAALYFGNYVQVSTMYVYNGLSIPVYVQYDGSDYLVEEHSDIQFDFSSGEVVQTKTEDGTLIETFKPMHKFGQQKYIYNVMNAALLIKQTAVYGSYGEVPDVILGNPKWITVNADFIFEEPPQSISTSSHSSGGSRSVVYGYSDLNPYSLLSVVDETVDMELMLTNHAKWDDGESRNIVYWLNLAASYDPSLSFVEERLSRNPGEVLSYRVLMDYSDSAKLPDLKERLAKLAASNPQNADYYYLKTRIMDDSEEQDHLFFEGYKKWPENRWLAMASAYAYASREDWESAYNAFVTSLLKNQVFESTYGVDFERVRRYVTSINKTVQDYSGITENNPNVIYYSNFENELFGDMEYETDRMIQLIHRQQYDEAIELTLRNPDSEARINRIIAASSQAPDAIVEKVLAYQADEGTDEDNIWMTLGTMVKHRKNYDEYIKRVMELQPRIQDTEKEWLIEYLELIRNNDFSAAEQLVLKFDDFRTQVNLLCVGVVAREDQVPEAWKIKVNRLLFATERPFITINE
ncbi:MAG: M48 family metallopeptidase [Flavobacteriales bacterium]|nr:M48 family metallopeptidase [Flavobacteriales bacterium]